MSSDTPASVLAEMNAFEGAELAEWERRFGPRVRALDARELYTYVFRTFGDSTLSYHLKLLRFAWADVSYRTWLDVLADIANDGRHVYFFLWFASESLALDIHRLPVDAHPIVQRELAKETYRNGGPHPISRRLRERMEDTFDYEAMWQRLEREGAPMRIVQPGEPDKHTIVF